jgi:hypothetical protein
LTNFHKICIFQSTTHEGKDAGDKNGTASYYKDR